VRRKTLGCFGIALTLVVATLWTYGPSRRVLYAAGSRMTDPIFHERISPEAARAIVEEAEKAGAAHPINVTDKTQSSFPHPYDRGTDARRCVEANGVRAVRSGDFVVWTFKMYYANWINGKGTLRYHPKYYTSFRYDSVEVVARRLDRRMPDERAVTVGFHSTTFFADFFQLPAPGRWMLVVKGGSNWGCFIYDLEVLDRLR
jgi:hypothetical protein